MLFKLFLLFTVVPLLELSLLIKVGGLIGVGNTIGLVLLTGAAGAWLARNEGLRVVREFSDSVNRGEMPTNVLLEGLLVVVGGTLLITPGIITDVFGFALVIPPSRKFIRKHLEKYLETRISVGMQSPGGSGFYYSSGTHAARPVEKRPDDDDVIDV